MKKILLVLLPAFLLMLTGCGPTAYAQFQEETLDLQNSTAVLIKTDFDGYEDIEISFDLENKVMKMDFKSEGLVGYVVDGKMYIQVLDMWAYGTFTDTAVADLFDIFDQSSSVFEFLPATDEVFGEEFFGLPLIDDVIALKKPQKVLVQTDENTYTIKGIEDKITITTTDGIVHVTLNYDGKERFISFTASESLTVPDEAKDGIDIGTI